MTDRKSISIDADLHAELKEQKQGGESWSDLLRRLTSSDTEEPQDHPVDALDALTEDHIDDIATRTARKTADEVETRFR